MLFILQALQIENVSSKFLTVTAQIEDALSHIPYNKLDLSEEVREQVSHLAILLMVTPDTHSLLQKIFTLFRFSRLNLCMLNSNEPKERWSHLMSNLKRI